ncbi:MAG: tetratricopeptide repeat protein [Bacteroidota bacterium]
MLRPKKKLSKRELKTDALVTTYVKATTFYEQNKRPISIGVTALAVIILATVVFFKNRADNNEKAAIQLSGIFQAFDAGQYRTAIDGVPEKNIPGLKSIVENYGNSEAGELARFYLANAEFNTGNYAEALAQFRACSVSDEMLEVSRLAGMGACYEAMGDHASAAEYFESAATSYSKDVSAAENLSHAARNYGEAGEKDKAIELYRRIKKNYPTTTFAREADRFISQLSV